MIHPTRMSSTVAVVGAPALHLRSDRSLLVHFVLVLLLLHGVGPQSRADTGRDAANFASGTGTVLYLAAGVGLPLLEDRSQGRVQALRSLDTLGTSILLSEGLKALVHERRPNGSGTDSFPSGHTTAAFAVATAESAFYPRQAPLWYTGATLIGISRVRLGEHHWYDVAAGALLGYGSARWELSSRRGLLLSPWIPPARGGSFGLSIARRF